MRGEQVLCPHCTTMIFICGQTICSNCIYLAIEITDELKFCETCNDFIYIHDEDAEECQRRHKTTQDKLLMRTKLKEMHPDVKLEF